MPLTLSKQLIPNLSTELKAKLEAHGHLVQFRSGDVLLRESSTIKFIPVVIKGSLKVSQEDADGNELFLYYVNAGESCVMSVFGGLYHDLSKVKAIADEDSEVLLIPVHQIRDLLSEFPEWLDFVLSLYHKRFEELLEVINSVAFKKVDERLLELLKQKSSHTNNLIINITHEQLALELGTARSVVSRLLKNMEDSKLLTLGRNKITLM